MKKVIFWAVLITGIVSACHENLEQRAKREAREYTERNCPTPIVNYTRTDSVTFDRATKTYTYHESFWYEWDNDSLIMSNHDEIRKAMVESMRNNTKAKTEKDASFKFAYVARSASRPDVILFNDTITPEDYR